MQSYKRVLSGAMVVFEAVGEVRSFLRSHRGTQVQTISVLSPIPSQWALQYFSFPSGMQLQAAFAHFLTLAIGLSSRGQAARYPTVRTWWGSMPDC